MMPCDLNSSKDCPRKQDSVRSGCAADQEDRDKGPRHWPEEGGTAMRHPFPILVLLVGLVAPAVHAGEPGISGGRTLPADRNSEDDLIQLNLPENMDVKALVDLVGRRLGINILYDEAALKKKVTVSAPAKVPTNSLLGILQSVLKMTGLTMVDAEQPGWKKIIPNQNLLSITGSIQEDPTRLAGTEGATAVTQVFPLKNVGTAYIEQMIKPFLSTPGGNSFSVEEQRLVVVTDYADNLRRAAQFIQLLDRPGRQASVRFVDVKNRDAADLAKQVNTLMQERRRVGGGEKAGPPSLSITPEPRTNQLVVVATEGADADALKLIETLDVSTGAMTRTYRFQNISPQRIDKLARDALGSEGQAPYKATVDAEGGLLIVTAAPPIHEKIEALKRELDVAAPEEQGYIRFYKLMNTSAADVLATIRALEGQEGGLFTLSLEGGAGVTEIPRPQKEDLSTGPNVPPGLPGTELPKPPGYRPPASETPKTGGPSTAPAPPSTLPPSLYPRAATPAPISSAPTGITSLSSVPGGPGAREVGAPVHPSAPGMVARTRNAIVAVDNNTNSLIVAAPPAVQRIYKQLIEALDKRRPQVMIEVTMVTLDTSNNFSMGVELSAGQDRKDLRWLTFGSFGLSTMNLTTGVPTLIPGAGFNGIILDPDGVNVVLRALATCGRAKVLSAPRILVNDNSTGTLSSVAEAPFTSVNASNTVATTSFAGYASAGTTVAVTPHISQDDYLRLGYSLTLNSFTGTGAGGVPPPRQTNTVDSEVVVPDGHTIIVGGLKRQDVSDTVSKIPLLGDLPGLGYLFSNISKTSTESSLFVFIRPVILRDDQFRDLKYLSEVDADRAEISTRLPESRLLPMR